MIFPIVAIIFTSGLLFGYSLAPQIKDEAFRGLLEEADMITELYNDTCSGSRKCDDYEENGYCTDKAADARGSDSLLIEAHYDGVECGSRMMKSALDYIKYKESP